MSARVHTDVTAAPLAIEAAWSFVSDPGAGAVVVFTGTIRDHSDGRAVAGLTYEAWTEEAQQRLLALAADVTTRWSDVRAVWIEHRTGALAIGEASVVVAVSADHRGEAFAAARYGIDTLKATVPIWKHEHWADGTAHWPGTD